MNPINKKLSTPVFDVGTGKLVALYSLPPKEAVIAAWEQHHKNYNTWEYAKKLEKDSYPLRKGKYGWCLGIFWAPFEPVHKKIR